MEIQAWVWDTLFVRDTQEKKRSERREKPTRQCHRVTRHVEKGHWIDVIEEKKWIGTRRGGVKSHLVAL